MKTKIVIYGYGVMGRAIGRAIGRAALVHAVDKHNAGAAITARKIREAAFVILAVKPQDAKEAIGMMRRRLSSKTVLISVMAGVPLKKLAGLSGHRKIVRMMPNLGLAVGEGIAVWKAAGLTPAEKSRTRKLLDRISENFEMRNENDIDKATAISGSGPAYFFLFADAMVRSAVSLGLSREASRTLVAKTFAAASVLGRDGSYASLIARIASKKGTTEAALKTFKKRGLDRTVLAAVRAAYNRAQELSHE